MEKLEVIVCGGGPTGLLLANLLGARGIRTLVVERNGGIAPDARAIGMTPPSLEILQSAGLADSAVEQGVTVRTAVVHGSRRVLGRVVFDGVHLRFPFVLSIPQNRTWQTLLEGTRRYRSVEIRFDTEIVSVEQTIDGVLLKSMDGDTFTSDYAVVADGAHDKLATYAGLARRTSRYPDRFFMADYRDRSDFSVDAHLWFTRTGAVESFPLPDGHRRWIVQIPKKYMAEQEIQHITEFDIESTVQARAGVALKREDRIWQSAFQPSRSELSRFFEGRLFVAGDAAHTMSPIGGQGLNTGFADAELISVTLFELLGRRMYGAHEHRSPVPGGTGVASSPIGRGWVRATAHRYSHARRRAARSATRRASGAMCIGTMTGRFADTVRAILVSLVLNSGGARLAAKHFAMQTIPYRRADMVLRRRRFFHPRYSQISGEEVT